MMGRLLSQYHHRAIHLPRTRRVAQALASLLAAGEVRSVLDVGAGDGMVGRQLAQALGLADIRGVDLAPRPEAGIAVDVYDGSLLPFEAGRFDAVVLSDVLHHAVDPRALLSDCLRVAARFVLVKDHFAFGAWSEKLLLWMDLVGNHDSGVEVRGNYLHPEAWFDLVGGAGGRIAALRWPLRIHDLPWRAITRSELQFAARIEHASARSR